MAFASIFVPNFMLQAVLRAEPELAGRAVALVEGEPPLQKVIATNAAASQGGIEIGMGGSQAAQFPGVEIRRRSPSLEKAAHAALLDVGWSASPRVEDAAPDTIVLDLAGLASLFESVKHFSDVLLERAAAIGLCPHIAAASNIEAAILAARGFHGVTLIPPSEEAARLASVPVEVLVSSLEMLETLHRWGIRTCGELAALPLLPLSERLGQQGVRLRELARGAHERALVLAQPDSCFEEEMALDFAVTELEPLSFLLGRLLDQLCARLEARSLAAAAFSLRLELQDVETGGEESYEIRRKSANARRERKCFEKTLRLPVPMRDSKTLLKLLRLQLQSEPPHGSIVKVMLAAEPARPRAAQKGLFIPDAPDPEKLEVTLARLAGLVGHSNVGSPELVNTHRPGEFRMAAFVAAPEESLARTSAAKAGPNAHSLAGLKPSPTKPKRIHNAPRDARTNPSSAPPLFSVPSVLSFESFNASQNGDGVSASAAKADSGESVAAGLKPGPTKQSREQLREKLHEQACENSPRAMIAFRTFRPELPATVESEEGCPCRIYFRGARGEVVAASGPWRTSGDWWEELGWRQDEWDMEVRFGNTRAGSRVSEGRESRSALSHDMRRPSRRGVQDGVYRLYYDWERRGWFVRGRYD